MNESYSLGPLEKELMDIIWKKDCVTVGDVHSLLQRKRKIAYTTVMTIMTRLMKKGLLQRTKEGKAFCYRPYQSKRQVIERSVKSVVHSFINQFGHEAVVAFTDELEKIHKKNT